MLVHTMPIRLLLPVALAQGLWVRGTTPRLPPARGHRGRCGTGADAVRVVGVGDSIVAGVGVDEQHNALVGQFARRLHERTRRPVEWRVLGLNGATSSTIAERMAPGAKPADVYLVSAGVNDVTHGVSARVFASNVAHAVRTLQTRSPAATVIFTGVPPLAMFPVLPWPLGALLGDRARRLQAAAREVLLREQALCFDFPDSLPGGGFASDGFHPAADACGEWAEWLLDLWLSRPDAPFWTGRESASPPASRS
jgi:lysophospholipase L1-like esterase